MILGSNLISNKKDNRFYYLGNNIVVVIVLDTFCCYPEESDLYNKLNDLQNVSNKIIRKRAIWWILNFSRTQIMRMGVLNCRFCTLNGHYNLNPVQFRKFSITLILMQKLHKNTSSCVHSSYTIILVRYGNFGSWHLNQIPAFSI